ncbi:senecionine N-oxygenase-like [Cylas formicarius]|uniref:senecionine N-oxygenase-like n=1 Tax=Cylas formicarius TaxID=197179 RepID=UPI0029585F3D|nr:senecionine N-oxygenase-like [Cylas formicarius]
MRVAIIGAGAAGLASARHISNTSDFSLDVFEMGARPGGTWVYTDDVGQDRYGYPVYSAMYKGLKTNLPKEVMGFPDFPIPEQSRSYLTQAEILNFLELYAAKFDLMRYIKLNTMVTEVRPEGNLWKITSVHKPTRKESTELYDAVMICNGHYNDPIFPNIPGQELFSGSIDHSHNFRDAERFKGKRVLVVGAGPSGLDLTLQASTVAEYVVLSHHSSEPINTQYPPNVELRPDVKRVIEFNKVEFVDGTCCCFDEILHCTGYRYSFPFLHESCGISVDENHIEPLYKHMIHIDRPNMCFIGIPFNVCAFQMFDLQARYFCKVLDGSLSLPSTTDMRLHTEKDMRNRWAKGYTKRQAHMMGPDQQSYYDDLAAAASTTPIAPVMVKLRDLSVKKLYNDFLNFRQDRYKILDEHNFVKV